MAEIVTGPSPAFVAQQQQQPDLLGQYSHLLQLKGLQQQQALAPLQQQEAQQRVQQGGIDLQNAQLDLKDRQAMDAAMHQWTQAPPTPGADPTSSTPNYDDLITLAKKNGASFKAIQNLQTSVLGIKEKAATIAKDDAQTGQDKANTLKTKNGLLIDAMSGIANLPDEQLAPALLQAAPDLLQKGLIDPEHVQQAQQLAQSGDPKAIRAALRQQIVGLGGFNKLLEDSQKKIQVDQEQGKSDPNSPFYAPSAQSVAMGTAPGAAQIQAGEVKQAAAKAGAEAKARQPYELALAAQRQALSQGDPRAAAQLLVDGDATLSELKSRGATPEFIAKTLYNAKQLSKGQYNAQAADAQFKVAQSPAQVQFFGSAKSLTDKGGTLDQLAETAKKIPQNQLPVLNSLEDWTRAAAGSGPLAEYAARVLGVADDYSKVMGGGQGSDASRLQAANLVAAKLSKEGREGAMNGIRGSVNSQIKSRIGDNPVLQRMYGSQLPSDTPQQSGAPLKITLPSGKQISIE